MVHVIESLLLIRRHMRRHTSVLKKLTECPHIEDIRDIEV